MGYALCTSVCMYPSVHSVAIVNCTFSLKEKRKRRTKWVHHPSTWDSDAIKAGRRFNPFSDVSVPERFEVQVAALQFELLYSIFKTSTYTFSSHVTKEIRLFHNGTI